MPEHTSPRVSVVLPTYNRAHLIEQSVRSVLEQTYSDFELIVVDDGSTDNTADVMEGFSDARVRYIRQPNRGRSNARNHALSLVRGEFITFIDSDDLYLPHKLGTQVRYLESHPGVGMIYTSAKCIDGAGRPLAHRYQATESGLIYRHIAFFTPVTITLPTVMVHGAVLKHVGGFDEVMHRFEDTDMWRRIAKHYRIDAIDEDTCLLRTHDDNSLLNQDPDQIEKALDYYTEKILRDDVEVDLAQRYRGLSGLYVYYGTAMASVPAFKAHGERCLARARSLSTLVESANPSSGHSSAVRSSMERMRRLFSRIRQRVAFIWRFFFYRFLNLSYKVFCKLRLIARGK